MDLITNFKRPIIIKETISHFKKNGEERRRKKERE